MSSSTDSLLVVITKFCGKCNTVKPIDEFNRDSRLKDGHKYHCKKCESDASRTRREERIALGLCHICRTRPLIEGKKTCPECLKKRSKDKRVTYERDFRQVMLDNAKKRAKLYGVPFNIVKEDIIIPYRCPILGSVLEIGEGGPQANSPSLDRLIPDLGYVKGNIAIISFRANRIKNDATLEELKKLVQWLENNNAN